MVARVRNGRRGVDIWPGFVDALSGLLIIILFVSMIFMVAQFFLTETLSGRDKTINRLTAQINELAELLSLEKKKGGEAQKSISSLTAELQATISARDKLTRLSAALQARVAGLRSRLSATESKLAAAATRLRATEAKLSGTEGQLSGTQAKLSEAEKKRLAAEAKLRESQTGLGLIRSKLAATETNLTETEKKIALAEQKLRALEAQILRLETKLGGRDAELESEKKVSEEARRQLALLNQQVFELRKQLAAIQEALDVAEAKKKQQEIKIKDLGTRLNAALATKIQQLQAYRSEFFGRLREAIGKRGDVKIVGDRFVFQSEVLFPSGSDILQAGGEKELGALAKTLKEVSAKIPKDIDWVLRVDGHTDVRPINTPEFRSNWELSAARAIAVVKYLIKEGIPARNLVAAGFGEFQPIDDRKVQEAHDRNRRIELKLTQR